MILDIFREKNTEIVFSVLPAWEMFFSMHVLSNPEHHASRKKWAESKEKSSPELIGRIRELDEITNTWTIIIDSDRWSEIRQMEIVEMFSYFRKMTIYQWNERMQYSGKTMSMKERDMILQVMEDYPMTLFSGSRIPVSCFPWWAKLISCVFPLTYCLNIIRFVFHIREEGKGWIADLAGLILCLCIMIAFTVFLIRKAEEHNRETGELQFY